MRPNPLPFLFAALLLHAPCSRAIEITAEGSAVVVAPGQVEIGGRSAAPAPILGVSDEPVQLSVDKPVGWAKGARLKACNARDVNARGSFVPGSLELRRRKGGELLVEGDDYLVDADWGHVGLGPKSRVTERDTVFASYRYSLLRMDTDAAARWEHLAKEGLPYLTLLHNTINHPDDRGHRLFAEELWKCFR